MGPGWGDGMEGMFRTLFWFAAIGAIATLGGLGWLLWFILMHLRVVW